MVSQPIELPQLVLTAAPSPAEKVAALQLIANSIAQQRQTLNRAIMLHPYFLAPAFALLAVLYRSTPDLPTLVVLAAGVTMALFSILSRYTSDYLTRAEDVGSAAGRAKFVDAPDRITVVARWGERVIGAVVVAVGDQKAEVWGWAVELRYRGKGLGRDLLEKAVKEVRERKGKGVEIVFADEHANSYRSPSVMNTFFGPFVKSEAMAKRCLKEVVERNE